MFNYRHVPCLYLLCYSKQNKFNDLRVMTFSTTTISTIIITKRESILLFKMKNYQTSRRHNNKRLCLKYFF